MLFDLNSGSYAEYAWGTLVCQYSPRAPASKETFLYAMSSLMTDAAPWDDDASFLATVAMVHELAHVAQDLTTGVGHSDFLTNARLNSPLLRRVAKQPVLTEPPPFLGDPPDGLLYVHRQSLLVYPHAHLPPERLNLLQLAIAEALGSAFLQEHVSQFSTQSLLESDAANTVRRWISSLRMSEHQRDVALRNRDAFDPELMPAEYSDALGQVLDVFQWHCDTTSEETDLVGTRLFEVILDSALAHPPQSWLGQNNIEPTPFEPGVKFLRMLLAFQQLRGQEMDRLQISLVNSPATAEAILLSKAGAEYKTAREVYELWLSELNGTESDVRTLRRRSAESRVKGGGIELARGIQALYALEAPVLYLPPSGGFIKFDWNARIVNQTASTELSTEVLDRYTMIALVDFLTRTGEFRCPYALASACPVASNRCSSGILHVAQVPQVDGCTARDLLRSCSLPL